MKRQDTADAEARHRRVIASLIAQAAQLRQTANITDKVREELEARHNRQTNPEPPRHGHEDEATNPA